MKSVAPSRHGRHGGGDVDSSAADHRHVVPALAGAAAARGRHAGSKQVTISRRGAALTIDECCSRRSRTCRSSTPRPCNRVRSPLRATGSGRSLRRRWEHPARQKCCCIGLARPQAKPVQCRPHGRIICGELRCGPCRMQRSVPGTKWPENRGLYLKQAIRCDRRDPAATQQARLTPRAAHLEHHAHEVRQRVRLHLSITRARWISTVRWLRFRSPAITLFALPATTRSSTSRSRGVSDSRRLRSCCRSASMRRLPASLLERLVDAVEQVLVAERLLDEIHAPACIA